MQTRRASARHVGRATALVASTSRESTTMELTAAALAQDESQELDQMLRRHLRVPCFHIYPAA